MCQFAFVIVFFSMIDLFAIRILDIQKGRNERNAMKYKSVRFDIKCFSKMIQIL